MKNLSKRIGALEIRVAAEATGATAAMSDSQATNEAIGRVWRERQLGRKEQRSPSDTREQSARTQRVIQSIWEKRRSPAPSAGDQ